jgi:folate-binding protein YgfZ
MENSLYQTACTGAVLFDLSSSTKVELAGPEALPFLHNLCSNDVKNLPEGGGCEAFLTTAKARVVAHGFVGHYRYQDQAVLWFDTVPGQAEVVVRHLSHFIVSEQVEIVDRTEDLALHRFIGPKAEATLEALLGLMLISLKHLHHQAVRLPGGQPAYVRRFDGLSLPGFDVISPRAAASWTAPLGIAQADRQLHEILRIEAGLPAFGSDIDDNRLVMEVGRTAQAISYTKGCFLGQEPIVMARDRGQVNRTLLGVKAAGADALARGVRLFNGAAEVGQVASSALSPRLGQVIALAFLKRGHQEPGLELVVEPATDGRKAVVAKLPFLP